MAINAKLLKPETQAQPEAFVVAVVGEADSQAYQEITAATDAAIYRMRQGKAVTLYRQAPVTRELGHVQINMTVEDAASLLLNLRNAVRQGHFQGTDLARLTWELAQILPNV